MDEQSLASSFPMGMGEEVPKWSRGSAQFLDPQLERLFQKENFELTVRRYARFSIPLAVIGIFSYGVHDYFVVPEIHTAAWLIRYGFFGPVGALATLFVLRNKTPARHQLAMIGFCVAAATSTIWIGAIAKLIGFHLYMAFAAIFVILGPFLARLSMRTEAVFTATTIAIYLGFEALVGHHELTYRVSYVMTIATMGTIGVLSARQLDVQARLAFIQRRVIREQMSALDTERHRSETLLLNVLPKQIAHRLKLAPKNTIADRFESATVLFSDIVGFTEMSGRLDAAMVVQQLDEVFSRFDEIADELGLEKIKTIGDAYMVAGGIPSARPDHVEAVCDMALRMRDTIDELAERSVAPMRVRIGMHTGPVVAGVIGKNKFIYDVWGDTVNLASRMESHGVPGAIQVSEAVYEATKSTFEYESRGVTVVKGKGEMRTYLLLRRRQGAKPRRAPPQENGRRVV